MHCDTRFSGSYCNEFHHSSQPYMAVTKRFLESPHSGIAQGNSENPNVHLQKRRRKLIAIRVLLFSAVGLRAEGLDTRSQWIYHLRAGFSCFCAPSQPLDSGFQIELVKLRLDRERPLCPGPLILPFVSRAP